MSVVRLFDLAVAGVADWEGIGRDVNVVMGGGGKPGTPKAGATRSESLEDLDA